MSSSAVSIGTGSPSSKSTIIDGHDIEALLTFGPYKQNVIVQIRRKIKFRILTGTPRFPAVKGDLKICAFTGWFFFYDYQIINPTMRSAFL